MKPVTVSPMRTKRTGMAPSRRRVRITLNADEWAILGTVARKYRKSLGWVLQVAAHVFLEPMPRLISTPGGGQGGGADAVDRG
jgi:hypothetical protein